MTTTTKTAPTFTFHVPNTPEGQAFITQLRGYCNYGHVERVRIRANGPRVATAAADGLHRHAYDQDLPRKHATSLRIYMDTRPQAWEINASRDSAAAINGYFNRWQAALSALAIAERNAQACAACAKRAEAELEGIPKWVRAFFGFFYQPLRSEA